MCYSLNIFFVVFTLPLDFYFVFPLAKFAFCAILNESICIRKETTVSDLNNSKLN